MTPPSSPVSSRQHWLLTTGLPIAFIVALVIALWLPFGFKTTGLVEEWGIVGLLRNGHNLWFADENAFVSAHAVRPLTFLPQSIAYSLDRYSFIGFNLQQIALFILKGVLVILIIRRVLPGHHGLAFTIGVLFVLYPADSGTFALRTIHIHMAIVAYLLAVYGLLIYWDKPRGWLLPLIGVLLAVSVLMYEVAYPVIGLTPVLLLYHARRLTRRLLGVTLLWYVVPLIAGLRVVGLLVTHSGDQLYHTTAAQTGTPLQIVEASITVFYHSLVRTWLESADRFSRLSPSALLLSGGIVVGFIVSSSLLYRSSPVRSDQSRYWVLIGWGILALFLGYSLYLTSVYTQFETFRTYLLASFGAALVIGTTAWLVLRGRLFIMAAGAFVLLAAISSFEQHQHYHALSLRQQRFLGQWLAAAPNVQPNTAFAIVDRTGWLNEHWTFGSSINLWWLINYLYSDPSLATYLCSAPAVTSVNEPEPACIYNASPFGTEPFSTIALGDLPIERLIILDLSYMDELQWVATAPGWMTADQTARYAPVERLQPGEQTAILNGIFACWPIENCTTPIRATITPAPRRFEFDGTETASSGFRAAEINANDVSFRWMISTNAYLLTRAAAGEQQVRLHVIGAIVPDRLAELTFFVNGTAIGLTPVTTPTGIEFTGIIPASALEPEIDYLEFRLPQLDQVPDTDVYLGLAVDWLTLEPIPND